MAMRIRILSVLAGAALAMFASSAQAGLCEFVGSAGLQQGVVDGDTTGENGKFFFSGTLGPCSAGGGKVCSVGNLTGATCANNGHNGTYKICDSCTITCTVGGVAGKPCPPNGAWTDAVIATCNGQKATGAFSGNCVGSNCTGQGGGIAYSLFFDAPTVANAVTQCSGTGSITNASFLGVGNY